VQLDPALLLLNHHFTLLRHFTANFSVTPGIDSTIKDANY
jgi:hypothetical protein